MDDEIKAHIEAAGVPLSTYTEGYTDLGPANRSALKRFVNICDKIYKNKLPLPPSPFIEFVVERTTGKSKQDFTGMIDGKKGRGKSTTTGYEEARYAIEIADKWGQDPKDYFSLDNCALLEDTEGIMRILEEAEKYQAIMLDDASLALGSRDFATQKNKNLNKIMTACRPKRWFVMQNAPMTSHIDLQQRELMDFVAHVYKSYHDGGFNIIKINSEEFTYRMGKKRVYEKRFSFYDRKIDFYCAYSPDIFDPFEGFMEKYDKQREEATNRLIRDISGQEKTRSNPVNKREKNILDLLEKHGWTIKKMKEELNKKGKPTSLYQISAETGLTPHMINVLYARLKKI